MRARSSMGMLSRGGDRRWSAGGVVGGVDVGIEAGTEGGSLLGWELGLSAY